MYFRNIYSFSKNMPFKWTFTLNFYCYYYWTAYWYDFGLTCWHWQVKQLLAADGSLHLDFKIPATGSSQNYTRSYYLNGNDYIISGSCDEHVVRVCCAQTGRRLRDISLEVQVSLNLHIFCPTSLLHNLWNIDQYGDTVPAWTKF